MPNLPYNGMLDILSHELYIYKPAALTFVSSAILKWKFWYI